MRIVFVRHGHPNYEKDCLTELGHRHAEAAALRLYQRCRQPYKTDGRRAHQRIYCRFQLSETSSVLTAAGIILCHAARFLHQFPGGNAHSRRIVTDNENRLFKKALIRRIHH